MSEEGTIQLKAFVLERGRNNPAESLCSRTRKEQSRLKGFVLERGRNNPAKDRCSRTRKDLFKKKNTPRPGYNMNFVNYKKETLWNKINLVVLIKIISKCKLISKNTWVQIQEVSSGEA